MRKIKIFSPARVDFAGGTFDIYPLYLFYPEIFTFNVCLDSGVNVEIREVKGKSIVKNLNTLESGDIYSENKNLAIGVLLLRFFNLSRGIELSFHSDFPSGSGLGISSSLFVSIFKGLSLFTGKKFSVKQTVEICKNIETVLMGYPAGIQDYLAPLYGGANVFEYSVSGWKRRKIPLKKWLSENMVFVFTGKSHMSGSPNWDLFKGFFDRERKIVDGFNNLYKLAKQTLDFYLEDNIEKFGKCLLEDFEIRKTMNKNLVPEIPLFDKLNNVEGVLGYRLCGAASGGTVAVCVRKSKRRDIVDYLKKEGYVIFDCKVSKNKTGLTV